MLQVNDFALEALEQDTAAPTGWRPKVAVVLGSGGSALADQIEPFGGFSFEQLWPWTKPEKIKGQKKKVLLGKLNGVPVICFSGRFHLYEGYTPTQVVQPMLLAQAMGVKDVILTNAVGGISVPLKPGDLMLVEDQIGTFIPNPLRGPNNEVLGSRFPDMGDLYSAKLREMLHLAANKAGVDLRRGILTALPGPSYETPAEIRMLESMGANAVGMSVIPEAIVAHWAGMRVACISVITNMAAGVLPEVLDHEDVVKAGKEAGPRLGRLINGFLDLYKEN